MSLRILSLILLSLLPLLASTSGAQAAYCAGVQHTGWSAAESWTWRQICAGEIADLDKGFSEPGAEPKLTAAFIESLLFDPQLKTLVPHTGVHIAGGEVDGPLELDNGALAYELSLERVRFTGDVDLHGLAAAENVSFDQSHFLGSLDLDGSSFGGNLDLSGVLVAGELRLVRASIGGTAELDDLAVRRGFNLERLSVAHNLLLRRVALSGISLLGASIKADILLQDASISGWAWLENVTVGSDLFLDRANLARTNLKGAVIGGNLSMTGCRLADSLDMRGIKVGQDLLMDKGSYGDIAVPDGDIGYSLRLDGSLVAGPLSLLAARIGHILSLGKGGRFEGPVDLAYVKVDGGVLMVGSSFDKGVNLNGATIGQGLAVTEGTRIQGLFSMTFARVGSNVDLTGGSFDSVDLTGTTIGAEIRLASKGYASIDWRPAAKLVLRNVSAKALQDLPDAWPTALDLEGFTYERLGGYRESEGNDVASRDSATFIDWLAKQKQYSPQPYQTLASVLRAAGFPTKAKEVLYAGSLREWNESSGLAWAWQGLRWAIVGFGLYPQRSAIWILVLVTLGAIIFSFEPEVRRRIRGPVDRMIYSLDALLPFVTLRSEHDSFDLQGWPKYYSYFHKVMGYVLIAFLLAAVTSLV